MISPAPPTPASRFSLATVGRHFVVCVACLVVLRLLAALVAWAI